MASNMKSTKKNIKHNRGESKSSGGHAGKSGAPRTKAGKAQVDIFSIIRGYANTLVKEEVKMPVPPFKGIDAPIEYGPSSLGYRLAIKSGDPLRSNLMSMFGGGKQYHFQLKSVFQLPASGAGYVNGLVLNTSLQFNNDFVSLTSVFSEFFVVRFVSQYQPNSRYNFLPNSVLTTNLSSLPVGVASLQHSMPTYGSLAVAADNFGFTWHNTADPFSCQWTNSEDINSTVMPEGVGTPLTQSWAASSNVANYQGGLQYLSQTTGGALPSASIVGHLYVNYHVAFRVRT